MFSGAKAYVVAGILLTGAVSSLILVPGGKGQTPPLPTKHISALNCHPKTIDDYNERDGILYSLGAIGQLRSQQEPLTVVCPLDVEDQSAITRIQIGGSHDFYGVLGINGMQNVRARACSAAFPVPSEYCGEWSNALNTHMFDIADLSKLNGLQNTSYVEIEISNPGSRVMIIAISDT